MLYVYRGLLFIAVVVVVFSACVGLALQLPFMDFSESMGNHDSKMVGADSVD
jgi:hypothetical protein